MTTQTHNKEAAEIRQFLEDWADAVSHKDIDALMEFYAPGIVSFDMIPPLRYEGKEAYRKNWEMGFEMCHEEGAFETHELYIAADKNVAFCHRLNRMSGTDKNGQEFECWVRWTVCLEKANGSWLITHEHISAPIDMETNQAMMNLKP